MLTQNFRLNRLVILAPIIASSMLLTACGDSNDPAAIQMPAPGATSDLNERVVTVVAAVTNRDCVEELITTQENLRFLAASNGSYVFKFFTGLDVNNEPTYLEYTIPVEE